MEFSKMYQRDLESLKKELELFSNEDLLWKVIGDVKNSAGNLALHLIGNLNHFIGRHMKGSEFVRDRDAEFSQKNISRVTILNSISELLGWLPDFLDSITEEELKKEYPTDFLGSKRTIHFMLVQLLIHLNYHLGQINYLRRML